LSAVPAIRLTVVLLLRGAFDDLVLERRAKGLVLCIAVAILSISEPVMETKLT
jgi:hypothetical protein